ncbi:helix-turn-helix transcriptional regulator [Flavobacterium sp. ST-87]|uniref:Helix-turn-helix transcriptional regulator n=1 Tax=Flavobacterium plantiphilum TaxID=3163297 RepID=A0ABW8XVE9_9FLAO
MNLSRLEIKKNITKTEDRNLSFRVFDLKLEQIEEYLKPHKKDHFCIFIIEEGTIQLHIEEKKTLLKAGKIAVIFPDQVHFLSDSSTDLSGKVILFEEVLFCSDILKNELSAYNVNLSKILNCVLLSQQEFQKSRSIASEIEAVYKNPSLIKKEQGRFYIKIFLLGLIESVHGLQPLLHPETDADKLLFIQFKKLLNEHYKSERTVAYYAGKLAVSTKKLNAVTKKHCNETAIHAIHNRILTEIKRQLLFSEHSHKEIAFDLGFSSPSALNKFVRSKLKETPTELQHELAQIYTV